MGEYMKIGILSMQRIKNYGSFLQALGLKILIEDLGHHVEFIDYHINPVHGEKKSRMPYFLYRVIVDLYMYFKSIIPGMADDVLDKKFCRFMAMYSYKYMRVLGIGLRRQYGNKEDVLVIGSDEVFNCLQNNIDVGFSMDLFGKTSNAKKIISYAASFGNTTIDKIRICQIEKELAENLKTFASLSVRDKNSLGVLDSLGFEKVYMHLDPVLIANYKEYIVDNVDLRDYVIVYAYSKRINENEANAITEFAQKHNKKLVCIGGVQSFCDDFIDCSPLEVLSYFKHADYIITDTFHGTIFSVVNRKQFVTIVRKSQGNDYGNEEKLTDLLSKLKLEDRQLVNLADMETLLLKSIDYTDTISFIDKERERTINYLKEQLS